MSVASAHAPARELRARWLGRIDFESALALQEEIVREHARCGDTLLLLEHEPVYTTGRLGKIENLPGSREDGIGDVPVRRIGRGGDVTYHGPGQLVGYALVDLRARGGDVHRFLRALEAGVLGCLQDFGVLAGRWPGRTGAWVFGAAPNAPVAPRKIASIGIGVRRGISMHGFAVNLSVDLRRFETIVPCGIEGVEMTSVERETGRSPTVEVAAEAAATRLASALDELAEAAR
ncbi:MAG: lipoyl(octanoyl) transferase LipB [Deltaproteobacteria bacterium]|nr:lipoyl(octanoyl) transferase LipB [Deltaproteobacteria bacterium]